MASTYNRPAENRLKNADILLQIVEKGETFREVEQALDEKKKLRDREWEEYTWKDFYEDMAAVDRTQGKRVYGRMHQTDHRGRDVFTGLAEIENGQDEGSHHALVDDAERDLHQRQKLEELGRKADTLYQEAMGDAE
jgi:hypothetical protein